MQEEEGTMVLLLESGIQQAPGLAQTPGASQPDAQGGTKVETRIHQRQCSHCRRWFWAWDRERQRCFVCDAPPPWELRRILEAINGITA
jgi:hypothetical protein